MTHPRLGWVSAPVGGAGQCSGYAGIGGVACRLHGGGGTDFGLRRFTAPRTTSLYVYARDGRLRAGDRRAGAQSPERPGKHRGLPVQSELLGQSGTLESTVSDEVVLTAARRLRILSGEGAGSSIAALLQVARNNDRGEGARQLLTERARVLGESVALLRDILNPDEIVVGGQAFTTFPREWQRWRRVRQQVHTAAARNTDDRFGNRVQEAGAGIVSPARCTPIRLRR